MRFGRTTYGILLANILKMLLVLCLWFFYLIEEIDDENMVKIAMVLWILWWRRNQKCGMIHQFVNHRQIRYWHLTSRFIVMGSILILMNDKVECIVDKLKMLEYGSKLIRLQTESVLIIETWKHPKTVCIYIYTAMQVCN
jgi:hypothetical protein